ncbi:MAG TPA: hypothetical protein VMS43_06450 [Allosphingosinicella sp.]|jgi:hypothetical protein|nr:hypothetical protein [Allosphingosinicella sp.]
MSARALLALIAVIAVPVAVQGAEPQTSPKAPQTRRVCETYSDINSRLRNVRRCRSTAERDQAKHEARQTVDRIQTMKATSAH